MKFTDEEVQGLKDDIRDGFGWWKRFTNLTKVQSMVHRLECAACGQKMKFDKHYSDMKDSRA